ncbi:hypothetical protein ACFPFV_03830 [Salinicoccus siamensis]|uniref:hypothetical protein n=1 Tax=Salinicoccus siamensis TaxID=381830 RepID=UPI00361E9B1D
MKALTVKENKESSRNRNSAWTGFPVDEEDSYRKSADAVPDTKVFVKPIDKTAG